MPLAVAVILKPDFGSVFAHAWQYAAGTIIGAACGALILAAYPPDPVLLLPAVVFAALLPYGMMKRPATWNWPSATTRPAWQRAPTPARA